MLNLESSSSSKHAPPHPTPPLTETLRFPSPAPSAPDFMTGLPDLLWGGCRGRNSWTTARGKEGEQHLPR